MKKTLTMILALSLALICLGACGARQSEVTTGKTEPVEALVRRAQIEVEGYGAITVELDAANAPLTVANFISLAESGFYDGLTFHRVIKGFMIQGGDPNGDGSGGSDTAIKGEFSNNGVDNPLKNTRGAIAMARQGGNPDSATSQFFIVHQDSPHLDGDYAVFGRVTEGMDIVDRICDDTPVIDNNGTVLRADQPVITSVKILD